MSRLRTCQTVIVVVSCMLGLERPLNARAQEASEETPLHQSAVGNERIWLCDLPEHDAHVGWGAFGKNGHGGFEDVPIALNGIPSPHGLGTHPDATVTYQLDKKYRTFRATVAVNDSTPGFGHPVLFSVEADGKPVWESRDLQTAHACQPVVLDITDVNRLTLKSIYDRRREGNGNWAHVVWIEPYVSRAAPDPGLVKALDPQKFREADERRDYIGRLRDLVYRDKFSELEGLAREARAKHDILDGYPRLHWFYQAVAHLGRLEEHGQLTHLEQLKRWQTARPQSGIPLIAAAWVWVDSAISLRAGASRPLGDEGWRLFRERISRAGAFEEQAQQLEAKDVELYAVSIAIATIQAWSSDKIDEFLDDSLKLDPQYSNAYLTRAAYLLPRREGKPGDLSRFAADMRKRLGGPDGEIAYARIALIALHDDPSKYRSQEFKPEDLRPALVAYCRASAGSSSLVQDVCHLACLSGDLETARAVFEQIPPGDCDRAIWSSAQQMEEWRSKCHAQSAGGQQLK